MFYGLYEEVSVNYLTSGISYSQEQYLCISVYIIDGNEWVNPLIIGAVSIELDTNIHHYI